MSWRPITHDSFTLRRLAKLLRKAEALSGINPRHSKQSLLLPEGVATQITKILENMADGFDRETEHGVSIPIDASAALITKEIL